MVWLAAAATWLGCLLPTAWPAAVAGIAMLSAAGRVANSRRTLLVLVGLLLVASGSAGARHRLLQAGPLMTLAQDGGEGAMSAAVVTDARASLDGAWLLVRVSSVNGLPSGRRALLRVDDLVDAPVLGARISFTATARPLGHDDFDGYLRSLHTAVAIHPVTPLRIDHGPPLAIATTNRVRERVRSMAARFLPTDHAALLSGLVAGDTTGLSEPAADALRAAGLSHLVAVSGSNVALVLAGAMGIAGILRLGARGQRRVGVIALLWFVVLVRGEPSVLRAAAMALLVLSAAALGRGHDARHTLGIAALLLLLLDPFLAGQLGFALSVLATAGVLVVGPAIAQRVPGPRAPATLLGATLGAQVGVAPVLLASADGLALGALPANLIAVPAAAFASAVGVVASLVAQALPVAGAVIAALAWPALGVVLAAGRAFADSPALTAAQLLSPTVVLVGVAFLLRRRAPRTAVLSGVVVVIVVLAPWGGTSTVSSLTLTALDVGQGDALLIEVPGAKPARMLIDGGPDETLALKALRSRGVSALTAVVLSHPHADHADGLPEVLSRLPVGALIVGPTPPAELDDPSVSAMASEVVAGQRAIPVLRAAAGQRFALGAAVVEVLSPPADGALGDEPNDNSLVLRVSHDGRAILLTGDVEEAGQLRLLQRPDLLTADVLKVPHHGGNTNAEGFLDAVGAEVAVIGVGADNDYGHPHRDVLADLEGMQLWRTDTDGTVSVAVE